jgi:hypothetical protein
MRTRFGHEPFAGLRAANVIVCFFSPMVGLP